MVVELASPACQNWLTSLALSLKRAQDRVAEEAAALVGMVVVDAAVGGVRGLALLQQRVQIVRPDRGDWRRPRSSGRSS